MSTRSEQQQETINTVQEKLITYQYQNLVNRPLVRHGNAANLEDKTKENFASVKKSYCSVLQIGCIPTDVQGVYIFYYCVIVIIVIIGP